MDASIYWLKRRARAGLNCRLQFVVFVVFERREKDANTNCKSRERNKIRLTNKIATRQKEWNREWDWLLWAGSGNKMHKQRKSRIVKQLEEEPFSGGCRSWKQATLNAVFMVNRERDPHFKLRMKLKDQTLKVSMRKMPDVRVPASWISGEERWCNCLAVWLRTFLLHAAGLKYSRL